MASATTDRRLGLTGDKGMKAPVDCATTANITLSGEQTIDGVTTSTSRVLVKNQTTTTQNGIYDTSSAAWTRSLDADGYQDLVNGTMVLVAGGTTQVGQVYQVSGTNPITIGTSAITFSLSLTYNAATVAYTPAGTGADATTVQAKLRQIEVSPEDFGAATTYNSAVDDRTFCQLAIDSLSAAGGGTLVLNRLYALNSFSSSYYTLTPKSNVSVRGKGPQTGFKIGNSLRSSTQGITILYDHTNYIENINYSNFLVDFNGQNNYVQGGWSGAALVNRFGGNIAANVHISNMWFKNSGGAHFVWFGLYSADSRNDNCSVTDCVFQECGQSIASNAITDHSSIYMGSRAGICVNNAFINSTQCFVSSALEGHSDDTVMTGNVVRKYNHGCNYGGDSNTANNVTISGNIFNSCVTGIALFTYSTYAINNLVMSGNTITVYDTEGTAYASGGGIIYSGALDTSSATSSNWTITDNNISAANNYTVTVAYQITGIGINPISGLVVSGNVINGMKAEGIRIDIYATKFHSNVLVAKNSIVKCGWTSTAGRRTGLALLSNAATYIDTNTVVRDNQITAGHAGAATDMDYGIQLNATGQFQNLQLLDNTVTSPTIQDILTPTAQTQSVKPFIRHSTSVAGHPFNTGIKAGWGSTWYDKGNGYNYMYRNQAGTNGADDGWNADIYANGDPSATAPFNAVGTSFKRGDTVQHAFPTSGAAHFWRCTTSGTGGAAAVWKSAGNLA